MGRDALTGLRFSCSLSRTVLLLVFISFGLYHWLSAFLTIVCLDVGFFVFIELGVSISYLRISVFFPFGSILLFIFIS